MNLCILPVAVIFAILAAQDVRDRTAGCREIALLGMSCAATPVSQCLSVLLSVRMGTGGSPAGNFIPAGTDSEKILFGCELPGLWAGFLLLVVCFLPGLFFLALSFLPGEPAGEGDGLALLAVGMTLRPDFLFRILFVGQIIAAGWALVLLRPVKRGLLGKTLISGRKLWIKPHASIKIVQKSASSEWIGLMGEGKCHEIPAEKQEEPGKTENSEQMETSGILQERESCQKITVPCLACFFAAILLALPGELHG